MGLKSFTTYGLGNTPIREARAYCSAGNLYLKLESANPNASIKDRTAYYIIKELLKAGKLESDTKLVESSSGNLGLAIAYFAHEVQVPFLCLVDPTIAPEKLEELEGAGIDVHMVSLGNCPDYRTARIQMARELDEEPDWIWTNQYDNPANFRAHYETTGPEIWSQTRGQLDYVVCSVGTGGTICGTGCYLKQCNPTIQVIAVEPRGSTIFGGEPGKYLSVGAGMRHPSGIFRRHGDVVDYYCKVDDKDALQECVDISDAEGLSVGITTGSVLAAACHLANRHPGKRVVAVAPDSGERYADFFSGIAPSGRGAHRKHDLNLIEYHTSDIS